MFETVRMISKYPSTYLLLYILHSLYLRCHLYMYLEAPAELIYVFGCHQVLVEVKVKGQGHQN